MTQELKSIYIQLLSMGNTVGSTCLMPNGEYIIHIVTKPKVLGKISPAIYTLYPRQPWR